MKEKMNMRPSRVGAVALAVVGSVAVTACGSSSKTTSGSSDPGSSASGTLNGAGSTFAAPIYQQWGSNLKSQGLTVNYNAVGSGTGVADLQTATADFAGDDGQLAAADKSGMKGT